MLFIGTMFKPTDRGAPAERLHHSRRRVEISPPELGMLVNEVVHCDEAEPWTFGTRRADGEPRSPRSAPRSVTR